MYFCELSLTIAYTGIVTTILLSLSIAVNRKCVLLLRCLVDDVFLSTNPLESQKMSELLARLIEEKNNTFLTVEVI